MPSGQHHRHRPAGLQHARSLDAFPRPLGTEHRAPDGARGSGIGRRIAVQTRRRRHLWEFPPKPRQLSAAGDFLARARRLFEFDTASRFAAAASAAGPTPTRRALGNAHSSLVAERHQYQAFARRGSSLSRYYSIRWLWTTASSSRAGAAMIGALSPNRNRPGRWAKANCTFVSIP